MSYSKMPKLEVKLPPNCQVKKRKGYIDIYFIVHPRFRPEGWPASIKLGRVPGDKTPEQIKSYAYRVYEEYKLLKTGIKSKIPEGSLHDCADKYEASGYFKDLALRTQKDYSEYLRLIRAWSKKNSHKHVQHYQPKHIIQWLNQYEDTPVKQKRARTVLKIVLGEAVRQGFINSNPITKDLRLRKRKTEKRKVIIWSMDDVTRFVQAADDAGYPSLGTAVLLAHELGQRQGDVLKLEKWKHYRDGAFYFTQNKTGKELRIPATKLLKARLESLPDDQALLVKHDNRGTWTKDTFGHKFREVANSCGLNEHVFMQLRHTAVLNLEAAGCTPGEIATITGHSLKTVMTILETYRTRSDEVAENTIIKLEAYREGKEKY